MEQAILNAVVKALAIYAVPQEAHLEKPEDDTCDWGVQFKDSAGKLTDFEIQIGSDGCCLNRYGHDENGEAVSHTLIADWSAVTIVTVGAIDWAKGVVLRMLLEDGRETKSAGQLAYEQDMIDNPVFKHGIVFNQPRPIWRNLNLASRIAWQAAVERSASRGEAHSKRRRGTAA